MGLLLGCTSAQASVLPDSLFREMSFRRMKDMKVPRSHHLAFVAGDDIVVVGGHTTGFVPTVTAEYYHDGRWRPLQPLYAHDGGFRVRLQDGRWMIAGGFEKYLGVGQTCVAEVYDSVSRSFSPLPIMGQKRAFSHAMPLPDGSIVIAGNHYAPDIIEKYRPQTGVLDSRPSRVERKQPFLFRSGTDDILFMSLRDNYDVVVDSVRLEYMKGEDAFSNPLLDTWKPVQRSNCNWTPESCAIDSTSYLTPVQKASGETGLLLVRDGELSLLPMQWDIPSGGPMNPIEWSDQLLIHRDRGAALLLGSDENSGIYICRVDYREALSGGKAPVCMYYAAFPGPHVTLDGAASVLLPDGRVLLTGGRYTNNFEPYTSVIAYYPFDGPFPKTGRTALWWWLAVLLAAGSAGGILLRAMKKPAIGEEADAASDAERMQRIRDLMEKEQLFLQKGLRIDDVATRMASNQKYISACINQNTGKAFTDFVNEYRVRYAQELLVSQKELKIQDIGERAGFSSNVSFHRNFLKITGKTPAEWRQKDS